MKLLFDQNISFRVVGQLKKEFPVVSHVKEFGLQFDTDKNIWKFARDNQYHIVTMDSDFNDLVTLFQHPPKIIWIRVGNMSSWNLAQIIAKHAETITSFLTDNSYNNVACLEIHS